MRPTNHSRRQGATVCSPASPVRSDLHPGREWSWEYWCGSWPRPGVPLFVPCCPSPTVARYRFHTGEWIRLGFPIPQPVGGREHERKCVVSGAEKLCSVRVSWGLLSTLYGANFPTSGKWRWMKNQHVVSNKCKWRKISVIVDSLSNSISGTSKLLLILLSIFLRC